MSNTAQNRPRSRLHLRLIRVVGLIIPKRLRSDWRREWEAELSSRELLLANWDKLHWRSKLDLIRRSLGAIRDALWLQQLRLEDEMFQDLRFGLRMLRSKPGFTAISIVTLAVGIGANTAIFSVVNAVLLQPLPYQQPDQIVALYRTPDGQMRWPFSPPCYLDLKNRNTVFTELAALSNKGWPANLLGRGEPERLQGYKISANVFPLLGVIPAAGRGFFPEEDRPGSDHVVLISHELWDRKFASDAGIVGESLNINGESYTVVGIMPADFRFYAKTDIWTPLAFTAKDEADRAGYLELIGRLKPGVTLDQASVEASAIFRSFVNDPNSTLQLVLTRPQKMLTREISPMLLLLFAAVGFVLLIACANVANLLLSRANARRREMAIRSALGAGRFRVVRQLLVESGLLAVGGGALGLALATWCIKFLASGLPKYLEAANSRVATLKLDGMALGFTLVVSLLTSVLFGLVPAFQLARIDLNGALREGGRTVGLRNRLGSSLVVVEIALATVLLVGAGMMTRSFMRLQHINVGFEPAGVLTAQIDPLAKYPNIAAVSAFYRGLLERIANTPGVRYAAIKNSLGASIGYAIDEHPPVSSEQTPIALINQVSSDYFNAMGIPLRAGRFFTDRDVKGSTPVIIVNDQLARHEFPDEDPIGKHITLWNVPWEIVGVVGSMKFDDLMHEPPAHIFFSYQQENWWSMSLVVKADRGDAAALAGPIRETLAQIDPDQTIYSIRPLDDLTSEVVAPQRFTTLLLTGFAALAVVLASIGIYGVMSHSVSVRTREIGVRMALGAQPGNVLTAVMKRATLLAMSGLAVGLGLSLALVRILSGLLFGIESIEPLTMTLMAILLLSVALVACLIPARRATRIDPISALRIE